MEELGKKMIEHCGGLPLAIKVLGGLLAVRHTLSEWERVFENIKSHIVGGISFSDKSVYYILHLSFEELPDDLKQCFLYLAQFPEDYTIDVGMLSYLWAAEGIRRPRYYDKATIREVADEYIEELVNRNMVISERDEFTLRFKTCHLHDMMREVCLWKAEEENFVHIFDKSSSTPTSQSPYKSRRLFIGSGPLPIDMNECIKNPKLRSLLILNIDRYFHRVRISFRGLELIRILDLSSVRFKGGKLPSSIGNLIQLRYFSLHDAEVTHLPFSMRNLTKLLYLNLDVDCLEVNIYVPNLNKMRELEYLTLPGRIRDNVKMKLGNLVNLVTLKNFSTKNSSVKDLHQMTKLKTLSIRYTGGCEMETLSSTLSKLRHVEDLSIIQGVIYGTNYRTFVLKCNDGGDLTQLYLSIYMPKLPYEFPWGLTTIHLEYCCLKEDPMPTLQKLCDLREVTLGWDSFRGKKMICSGGGFPKLQKLKLCRLKEWEEWIVEEGSMPLLHTLLIKECYLFKQLPDALQFITSLKNLKLCDRRVRDKVVDWKKKLSEGGEDHYKVQHIPHVEII